MSKNDNKDYGLDYYGDLAFKYPYDSPVNSDSNKDEVKADPVPSFVATKGKLASSEDEEKENDDTPKKIAKYLQKLRRNNPVESLAAKWSRAKGRSLSVSEDGDDEDDEDDDSVESKDVKKAEDVKPEEKTCKHCDTAPCVMSTNYEGMMLIGSEMEESEVYTNKEIRHAMY
jgi:hypothetical protein